MSLLSGGFGIEAKTYFLLSYGDRSGLVPIGTFIEAGFVDLAGNAITEDEALYNNGYVLYKRIELDQQFGYQMKESQESIKVPYFNFVRICNDGSANNEILEQTMYNEKIDPHMVEELSEAVGETLAICPPDTVVTSIPLIGTTLEETKAIYINGNGDQMGNNYTIHPFDSRMFKTKAMIYDYWHKPDDERRKKEEVISKTRVLENDQMRMHF